MTRLEQMRQYRSILTNDILAIINKHIEDGNPLDTLPALQASSRVRTMQQRVRTMNVEIDKLEAIRYNLPEAKPDVLQYA
jgi:hypothetical protein